jgi:hypothetical protein
MESSEKMTDSLELLVFSFMGEGVSEPSLSVMDFIDLFTTN